jgi:hypothetical protein
LRGVIDLKVVVETKQQRADSGSGLGLVLELVVLIGDFVSEFSYFVGLRGGPDF